MNTYKITYTVNCTDDSIRDVTIVREANNEISALEDAFKFCPDKTRARISNIVIVRI